jgi:molybdopterin-synthase adenylyltransferase
MDAKNEYDDQGRYEYHVRLPEIGATGQAKLSKSRVAIVGAGTLGTFIADRLTRAGIGHIRIIDNDVIEPENLQRQLYTERDAAQRKKKIAVLMNNLSAINSSISIEIEEAYLDASNCHRLLRDIDVVADATDNLESRLTVNDYVLKHDKAWVFGGVGTLGGLTASVIARGTPCLRCIEEQLTKMQDSFSDELGLLNTPGLICAGLQATEVMRSIIEGPLPLDKCRLTWFDAWNAIFENYRFRQKEGCVCRQY